MKASEFASDDWRTIAAWLFIAVSTLIAGFVLGWCWRDRPDALGNVRILDVLIAFGTVGTAIAAVTIPSYQNRDRLREQRYNELLVDWVLAQDVLQLCHKLRAAAQSFGETWESPSEVEIQHLYAQLQLAKQATIDNLGRLIINDLLFQVIVIQDAAKRRAAFNQDIKDHAIAANRKPPTDSAIQQSTRRLDELYGMASEWIDRILIEFRQIDRLPMSVVSDGGQASMGIVAKGVGHVR